MHADPDLLRQLTERCRRRETLSQGLLADVGWQGARTGSRRPPRPRPLAPTSTAVHRGKEKGPRAFRGPVVSGMSAAFGLRLLAGPSDGFDGRALPPWLQTSVHSDERDSVSVDPRHPRLPGRCRRLRGRGPRRRRTRRGGGATRHPRALGPGRRPPHDPGPHGAVPRRGRRRHRGPPGHRAPPSSPRPTRCPIGPAPPAPPRSTPNPGEGACWWRPCRPSLPTPPE